MIIHNLLRSLAATVVLVAFSATQSDSADKVRIATEGAYPPFSFVDASGKLQGFDVDIANALCAVMKRECDIVQQDWDGIIPGLLANKYDAIVASMSITAERMKKVDFTEKYYQTPNKFVSRKDAGLIPTPEKLAGKRIGVARGSIHQCFVELAYPKSELVLYASQEEVFQDLALNRIDLSVSDSVQANESFLSKEEGKNFKLIGGNLYDSRCHGKGAGIAVRKGDKDLREAFDSAIKTIRINGTYKLINQKYFDFDLYGN